MLKSIIIMRNFTKEERFLIDNLVAAVKFNNGLAFIFGQRPYAEYIGHQVDHRRIYETNGIFYQFYSFDSFGKAFAGRKWNLKMKSGETKDMTGMWYSCGPYNTENSKYESITFGYVHDLTNCYVFSGAYVKKGFVDELIKKLDKREVSYINKYDDGKKLLKYDIDRKKTFDKEIRLEKKIEALKKNAKQLSEKLMNNGIFHRHSK